MAWTDIASIIFGRNTASGLSEQIDKTDDARNALHVSDQHAQGLTDAQLRAAPLPITTANLDITLSALRDALRGGSNKTLTDLETALTAIQAALAGQEAAGLTDAQLRAVPVPVDGTPTMVTGSAAAVADLIAEMDVSRYAWVSIQITGITSATVSWTAGNVSGALTALALANRASSNGSQATTTTGNATFAGPLDTKYLRVRVSTWVSGAVVATVLLHPFARTQNLGSAIATGPAAIGAAVSGNPVRVAGRASTALPTEVSADGDVQDWWLTRRGAVNVTLRDSAGVELGTPTNPAQSVPQPANNLYGSVTGVTSGASSAVVQIAASAAGYKLTGFHATGTGDGYFFLQVGGSTVAFGRIGNIVRAAYVVLPNPIAVSTGSLVALRVTNEALSTADYDGVILGA